MYRREPIFAQSLTGLHRMPWIRWRGPSWTLDVTYIVAKPTQRQYASPLRRRIAPGAMDRAEIEQYRVTRLHLPLEHLHALLRVRIGGVAVAIGVAVEIALIGPMHRLYAFLPTV